VAAGGNQTPARKGIRETRLGEFNVGQSEEPEDFFYGSDLLIE
jgi:hypothetical protein